MSGMSGLLNIRSEAFFTLAENPTLLLDAAEGPFDGVIEEDAFGNAKGGHLWGRLEIALWDFPELAFRLMLKAHFDLGRHGKYSQVITSYLVLFCTPYKV